MSDDLEEARGLKTEVTGQIENIGYKELMEIVMSLPTGFRTVFNMYAVEGDCGYLRNKRGDFPDTVQQGKGNPAEQDQGKGKCLMTIILKSLTF